MSVVTEQAVKAAVFPGPRVVSADPFVTNIKAYRTEVANEFAVDSYLLFLQSRQDEPTYDMASAERRDILLLTDDGFKLVRASYRGATPC